MTADDRIICEVCGKQQVDHALAMLGSVVVAGSYRDDEMFGLCIEPCIDIHLATIANLTTTAARRRRSGNYLMAALEVFVAKSRCECLNCTGCGRTPKECSGTDCSRTCDCQQCDHCQGEAAISAWRDARR
jgi:hypothetical protein